MTRPHITRTTRGWRVSYTATDDEGRRRSYTTTTDTWDEALEHALHMASLFA